LLLGRLVFARLDRVAADVRAVGAHADLSGRIKVEGDDELSALAKTINRTLEALESSRVQLAESEQRLALVLDAMSEGVWHRNLKTGETYYSPQWIRSLGYSREEAGREAGFREQLLHPDDRAREEEAIKEHIEKRTLSFHCEVRLRMQNGRWRWHLERGKVVEWSQNGEALRMVGTDRDITDQRRLEQQFFQTQKMEAVGKLASGIAHDFNNLLTIIVGQSAAIRNDLEGDSQIVSRTEEINHAAQKAASLTRQLLAFSRNQTLHPQVIDLRVVVDSIEEMLCRTIGEDILLKTIRTPQPAWVKADISQIEQVLVNMAVNARDAMPSGGQLVIEISDVFVSSEEPLGEELPAGDYVMIEITDTGIGMSEAIRTKVFEPFFTTKAPGEGSGLGLAACYGIIKQSGGHVAVRSEPGVGSTFSIYLPAADAPTRTVSLPKIESKEMPRGHETVIVVEDEPIVRELAVEILRSCGYEVLEAGDGLEARKVVTAFGINRIDIVVTDVVMPNMGGKEFRDWFIKERPDGRVLFISGYTSGVFSGDSGQEEQFTLLEKPFTPAALARKVREVLDQKQTFRPSR
jgi:PAS domain S-box-containing protein